MQVRRAFLFLSVTAGAAGCVNQGIRKFPDRPVAWQEHDDQNVPEKPEMHIHLEGAYVAKNDVQGALDRGMAFPSAVPAADVNALDEVPCSTWFCPRNHLKPMTPEEVA